MLGHLKKYTLFLLCTALLNATLLSHAGLSAEQTASSDDETVQSAENHNQSDENQKNNTQEEKPTFKESWRKVVTFRWKELSKADAWNISTSIVSVSTATLLCHYRPHNSLPNTHNYGPAHNNPADNAHKPVIQATKENKSIPEKDTPTPREDYVHNKVVDSSSSIHKIDSVLKNNNIPQQIPLLIPGQPPHITHLDKNKALVADIQHKIAHIMIRDFLMVPKIHHGHTDKINTIAINGGTMVTGSKDYTAKIWDITKNKPLHTLEDHTYEIDSIAIHGDKVVTGSGDGTIKIWNIHTGQLISTIAQQLVLSVAISGDTVVTGLGDGTAKIWDINDTVIRTLTHDGFNFIASVAISGDTIITGATDETAKIWHIDGTLQQTLEGHSDYVLSVAIGNDTVVTGSKDNTAKIWHIDGTPLHTLEHTHSVTSVAISGDTVVTRSDDGTVKIWNMHTGQLLYTLLGHAANCVAIHGNTLVAGSDDGITKIWSLDADFNTSEFKDKNHALYWIKDNLSSLQANLIARAYAENESENSFIINTGTDFDALQKTGDMYIWLTLPTHVRDYLISRLNIQLQS